MGIFFDDSTPKARALLKEFDTAFTEYRERCIAGVKPALEIEGLSFKGKLAAHCALVEQAPLPSAANHDAAAFSDYVAFFKSEQAMREGAMDNVKSRAEANVIRDIFMGTMQAAFETVGRPEFAEIFSGLQATIMDAVLNPGVEPRRLAQEAAPRELAAQNRSGVRAALPAGFRR